MFSGTFCFQGIVWYVIGDRELVPGAALQSRDVSKVARLITFETPKKCFLASSVLGWCSGGDLVSRATTVGLLVPFLNPRGRGQ